MAESKKYYWLKLKEDFFRDKEIKKLRRIAGGDTYTIIYLKLQLLSLKNEGKLFFDNIEDTFAEEMALELDEDTENVKITLLYLQKCGLIEEVSTNEYMLPQTVKSIGNETLGAERVRRFREKQKALLGNGDVTNGNTEIDIEIEKDIDKDIEIDKKKKPEKKHYADNVTLTEEEYNKLINEYGKSLITDKIEDLDLWKGSKGKKTKSDYMTIRQWIKRDAKNRNNNKTEIMSNAGAYKAI